MNRRLTAESIIVEAMRANPKLSGMEFPISAFPLRIQGIDTLREMLIAYTTTQQSVGDTIVTNARHYEALIKAEDAMQRTLNGLEMNIPGDLLAQDIREAMHYIGEITGQISTTDLLQTLFSKFCIGK